MSSSDAPIPYRVTYSGRVLEDLPTVVRRARDLGLGRSALDALREIDRRLRIYPQFGDPFRDVPSASGTEWIGFVGPLVVRYVLLEDARQVWVVRPIALSRERP